MHKLLAATAAVTALAAIGAAHAADMPLKAPPLWPDWTGFYVGVNGGYSWGNSSTSETGAGIGFVPYTTSQSMDGWLGGAQIGYNRQAGRNWLIGVEADIQATSQDGSVADPTVTTTFCGVACTTTTSAAALEQKLPWFGTVRARLGIEPSARWLIYATGGLAFGEVESTASFTTTATSPGGTAIVTAGGSSNTLRTGWAAGGGTEWRVSGAWTAKLEYLYMDLGTVNSAFTGTAGGAYTTLGISSHITDNIVRAGINYHFW